MRRFGTMAQEMNRANDIARDKAERKIQAIILDLEKDTGLSVDNVRVDTRNFANHATEITFK